MITFWGFVFGQFLALILQITYWVTDERGWGEYLRHRRHQAQHVRDLVLSGLAMLAWGAGLARSIAAAVHLEAWVDAVPTKWGFAVAALVGFALCFVTRFKTKKAWFASNQDEDPPTPPKGD